jgi:hypothetical protein
MFEDLQTLRANRPLFSLLSHYDQTGLADREVWQDRVMELDGVRPEELSKLHGLLLAGDWIEQNTGNTPVLQRGSVRNCYRVTTAGQRVLRKVEAQSEEDDESLGG